MSNSTLVNYTKLSPNHSGKRNHKIDTISIHCMAGNLSVESCGNLFSQPIRKASSNYGIGSDGRIALYVDEVNRSWCTSSSSNDNRAVTIEIANIGGADQGWPVSSKAYSALIDLLVDICKRNDIKKLLWKADKTLIGQVDKQNMTVHRWFANKSCPGDWLYNKHTEISQKVNERLLCNNPEKEEENMPVYTHLQDVPQSYRPAIKKLMEKKALVGYKDPDPRRLDDNVINVTEDFCRVMTVLNNMGKLD